MQNSLNQTASQCGNLVLLTELHTQNKRDRTALETDRPRDLSTNPPLPRIFFFPSLFSSSSSRTPRATNATLIRFNYRPTDRPTDYARLRQRHPLKRLRLDATAAAMVMLPHCCCAPSHEEVKVRTNECILTHIWDNTPFFGGRWPQELATLSATHATSCFTAENVPKSDRLPP